MNRKAIILFSGGLDSILAIKLMLEQEIELHALYFSSVFCDFKSKKGKNKRHVERAAAKLNVPLTVIDTTEEFLEIVKNPRHGRGSNMNPCIDCRIFSFKKAKAFMEDLGASFIVTGEVLGERPMSQTKRAISFIETKSSLGGLVVRPLSAKLLEPTLPEKSGIVDRNRLLDIQGRRRDRQFALAERFGITEYPNPAGGCLLTDKGFSHRLKDLLEYNEICNINDLELLKIGRHFRISEETKLFVGRDKKENSLLISFARPGDYIFDVINIPSPIGLVRGAIKDGQLQLISSIIARYSDVGSDTVRVSYKLLPSKKTEYIITKPGSEEFVSSLRL